MDLSITQESGRAHFRVQGEIDERGAEQLKSGFKGLNAASLKEVTFDFSEVNHIGSAGIGKLLLFYKDLAVSGGKIQINNLSGSIYDLFTLLKLDELFTITRSMN